MLNIFMLFTATLIEEGIFILRVSFFFFIYDKKKEAVKYIKISWNL